MTDDKPTLGWDWVCPDRMIASMLQDKSIADVSCPDCKAGAGEQCERERSRDLS